MSHQAVSWVLECCPDVRGSERLVLLSIANHADPAGDNAWPSIATMAREAALSETRTKQAVRALVAAGVIDVTPNAGGPAGMRSDRRPNLYTIHLRRHRGDEGHTGDPRGDRGPQAPPGPPSSAQIPASAGPLEPAAPDPAASPTRDTRVPPVAGARGSDHEGHGGQAAGGTGGTRVTANGPVFELPGSERSSSFEPAAPDRSEEEVDLRLAQVWPILAELRLAARTAPDPIRDRGRWLRRVASVDRAELETRAADLIAWHPTLTADHLAQVLFDPRSPVLAAHPRRVCSRCDGNGMADLGSGYGPCPVCRPPATAPAAEPALGAVLRRLDEVS